MFSNDFFNCCILHLHLKWWILTVWMFNKDTVESHLSLSLSLTIKWRVILLMPNSCSVCSCHSWMFTNISIQTLLYGEELSVWSHCWFYRMCNILFLWGHVQPVRKVWQISRKFRIKYNYIIKQNHFYEAGILGWNHRHYLNFDFLVNM